MVQFAGRSRASGESFVVTPSVVVDMIHPREVWQRDQRNLRLFRLLSCAEGTAGESLECKSLEIMTFERELVL